jgi:hypothetical protein
VNPLSRALALLGSRRATRRYLRLLPRLLSRDYGHRGPYTPEQVETTIRRHRVTSLKFAAYAMAIFSDRDGVEARWRQTDALHDYERIRRDIGSAFFGGDAGFTPEAAARHSSETYAEGSGHQGHGGGHNDSSDGGGHH